MLFYEYFLTKINTRIYVVLKNGMEISGILMNVDPYLNLSLKDIHTTEIPIQNMENCSVRGLAIRTIEIERDNNIEKVNDGSRLCISDLQKNCY